ncbi:DUF1493 family protein [Mucilaginibacter auburnensis]|uniref:Acyl carrier protein n=1 Tax=Mucilaginibacter auburnensis TaxID=1457233 RepID=A0A2H9VRA8_9SPHI|nr:DUF1493 family protein [Mucilaginibacter auburnensis]PJJ83343.1 acyl carrier protein [Mucilaginibacter auburnensis]
MKEDDEKVFEQLKCFISNITGVAEDEIFKTAYLEKDLGVFGDDTIDLLLMYCKEFNVDLSGFDVRKYVSPEGDTLLPAIIRLLTGRKNHKQADISVLNLINGVLEGRLDETVINA